MLDPDPTNEIGKGIIDPTIEAWLLANGYVYAIRRPMGHLAISKRPMKEALADLAKSLGRIKPRRIVNGISSPL